ncbi:MAG: four helix bundle protein [Chloroflexota bacterium]|jgi:four helix bundle protein
MVAVRRFEELLVWQRARELTKSVYAVSSKGQFSKDWGLSGQIQRAAVSVMSNIAEGFERFRRGEFVQFLSIAKGSCGELRSQIYVAHDLGYIDDDKCCTLLRDTERLSKQIGALRAYIERDARRLKNTSKDLLRTQNPEPRTLGGSRE